MVDGEKTDALKLVSELYVCTRGTCAPPHLLNILKIRNLEKLILL